MPGLRQNIGDEEAKNLIHDRYRDIDYNCWYEYHRLSNFQRLKEPEEELKAAKQRAFEPKEDDDWANWEKMKECWAAVTGGSVPFVEDQPAAGPDSRSEISEEPGLNTQTAID